MLARLLAPGQCAGQPPLCASGRPEINAVISSLALGGAERIVLDWAGSSAARYRVRLVVLRTARAEWPVPPGVRISRLPGDDSARELELCGAEMAAGGNPVVLCHLLTAHERRALARGGALPVPVLHNAAAGWPEAAAALADAPWVVAVSRDAARELAAAGCRAPCAVIHHVPRTPAARTDARREWRARWALPPQAVVLGMIGAVKPQKSYTRALRVLAALHERRDAWLAIIGGPVGRDGMLAWNALLAQARRLGVEDRVRLPGFLPRAADCLPAFDLLLNTSRHEGLSIATLEALAAGLPVVASQVGGQGELPAPGLTLLPLEARDEAWAAAVDAALGSRPALPAWRDFPSHRLWTLLHLVRPYTARPGVLFVTANLNAGGAQRSLYNLALWMAGAVRCEIAVCGNSSSDYFSSGLRRAGIAVYRSEETRDCFDHAAGIVRRVVAGAYRTVCFWNADAKVKLLLAKTLAVTEARLVDVSPGGYADEEMRATRAFQASIAFSEEEYWGCLVRLVLKYHGAAPAPARGRVTVIPNGVPVPSAAPRDREAAQRAAHRIVMNGRIAPSKFLVEAVAAMRLLWRTCPAAELHVMGRAEERHAGYASALLDTIGDELGRRVVLHGESFDAPDRLAEFGIALVLGEHQGCPNAVLEALAAGVPVVANDSGGTRELVIDGRTGLLLRGLDAQGIAAALGRLIEDPDLARRLGGHGRKRVQRRFSMERMRAAVLQSFRVDLGGPSMLTLTLQVPAARDRTAFATLRAGLKTIASGPAVVSASQAIAAARQNPDCDPLRLWGHPPLGEYRLLAHRPTKSGQSAEYGGHFLLFQPESGQALAAEPFGRLALLAYGGPSGRDRKMRRTQGGLRLTNQLLQTAVARVEKGEDLVLRLEPLAPPPWWKFWARPAATQPLSETTPALLPPPGDELSILEELLRTAPRRARPVHQDSDDDRDWNRRDDRSSSSSRGDSDSVRGRGGEFAGGGASGAWGGPGVDQAGRIAAGAAAGAALGALAGSALSSESPDGSRNAEAANPGSDRGGADAGSSASDGGSGSDTASTSTTTTTSY